MSNFTRITIEFTDYTIIPEQVADPPYYMYGFIDLLTDNNIWLRPFKENGYWASIGQSFLSPGYFKAGTGYISSNNQQALEYLYALYRSYTPAERASRNIASIQLDANKIIFNLTGVFPHNRFQISGERWGITRVNYAGVAVTIQDELSSAFAITNVFYQESETNKCDFVRVRVNVVNAVYPVTITYNVYGSNQQKIAANSTEMFVDIPRQHSSQNIIVFTSNDNQVQQVTAQYVRRYQIGSVDVISVAGISTATVNATLLPGSQGRDVTPLMYSINDVNYQTSNVFPGLVDGGYTAYIIDALGCKKSMQFSVQGGIQEIRAEPFFDISITNPLRFVDKSTINEFENIENSLSDDLIIPNVYNQVFRQPFGLGDVIRTQVKANYENIVAKIYDCDNNLVQQLTPELRVNNFGLIDKRDCFIKSGGEGKAHVYFFEGNIYDPDTGDVINTYFTPGRLPTWAQAGVLLYIQNSYQGYYIVNDIAYDNDANSWVMVIDLVVPVGETISDIVTSKYNLEPWNVYEFGFTQNAGQYYVIVEATDTAVNYPNQIWQSEPFVFADFNANTVTIDYYDSESNAGIVYETGIQYRLRVPGRLARYNPESESEEFRDDMGVIRKQKTTYNRNYELETSFIPWWMVEKISILSGHSNIKINGIDLVLNEEVDVTDKIDENNPFYIISAVYQRKIDIDLSDKVGIISGQRGVIGINEQTVIGV